MPNFSSIGIDVSSFVTFWTACPSCKMQYQYLRKYEDYQLQCPKCMEVYLARDNHRTAPSKRAEAEKEVRGKEKELRNEEKDEVREEREVFRKAREAKRSGKAMEGLMVNCKQQEMARNAGKAKVDGISGRKLKRRKQNNSLPGLRPSGAKKNAAAYKVDISDDSDFDDFPDAEWGKIEGGAEDGFKSEDEEGLMVNCKEQEMARDAGKAKVDGVAGRKLKSRKQNNSLPGLRPSGTKKNAAAHIVDISDDSDFDDFPDTERGKIEGGAEDGVKSEDEEASLPQSEKLLKDKYVGNDRNQYGRRGVGPNSSKELDGRKHVNEKSGGEPGKEDLHKNSPETFWTSCSSCKMQKEYLRQYQYYQLQCPKCKEYFLALEINSTATSNGIGGFGLDFDPHWQDFGSNNQRASAAGNASDNGLKNVDQGGFNAFPNHASSAAFFSSAAAAAAQLRARVEAAVAVADAAISVVPQKNLAADVAQKTFVKVKREKVGAEEEVKRKEEVEKKEVEAKRKEDELKRNEDKLERKEDKLERKESKLERKEEELERKEKELKRKEEELERKEKELERKEEELRKEKERLREEKEVQRKALEAARCWEAVQRLVARHKQQEMARDARNGNADAQAVRKVKRKQQEMEMENVN